MIKAKIQEPSNSFVDEYPQFLELVRRQKQDLFWSATEIDLEKDRHDLLVNLTKAERHAVMFNQRLFSNYERMAGEDYWSGRVLRKYSRHEIKRMASCFSDVEFNTHLVFYTKVNEVLGVHNDKFYEEFMSNPLMVERMSFIESLTREKDDAASIAGFSMIEGAVLFTAFAMLKSFRSNGRNLLANLCAGINMSALDEDLHMQGAAAIFRLQIEQEQRTPKELETLHAKIYKHGEAIFDHECLLIDAMLAEGDIEGASRKDLKLFAQSRTNICLDKLGLKPLYELKENPIGDWFYLGMNGYNSGDFFSTALREYSKIYTVDDFSW